MDVEVPSGLGSCLGENGAVATVGSVDKVLSPETAVGRIGALGGDAFRLPLYVAIMVWVSGKEKCWFRFIASSLSARSSSSFLCLWGLQHQECIEQLGTVHV